MLSTISLVLLLGLLLGSWAYCVLVWKAARDYQRQPIPREAAREPISVLRPLAGLDEGLEENLRSTFEQEYPEFEILFAMRTADDPAYAVAEKLRAEYPQVLSRIILTGEPPWPNAKSWSLHLMQAQARFDLLVMADSDIRVDPRMLHVIGREFTDPKLAVTTCPYRAIPGNSIWTTLEAIGMNTEFLGGLMVARFLEGVRFAVGPTIAARKSAIDAVGGWAYLQEFLAEDFVLGNKAAALGMGVALSRYIVEHRIGAQGFVKNATHRIRWCRSTRRSRSAGYVGQIFTNPLPIALAVTAVAPAFWPLLGVTILLRWLAAHATAGDILNDSLWRGRWYLVPVQDLLSFAFWIAGFFGNTIDWRGARFRLLKDGRFEKLS